MPKPISHEVVKILERRRKKARKGDEYVFSFTVSQLVKMMPRLCDGADVTRFGFHTRDALLILEKYHMNVSILTKGGVRAVRDFDILERNGWWFGTTLSFLNKNLAAHWEPGAATVVERFSAMLDAGPKIPTWVSLEPVIDPAQALKVIKYLHPIVDHWKIGKINYHKYIEEREDWGKFLQEAEKLLEGKSYYIKKDLEAYRK